jgi:hypothetical protein
MVSLALYLTGQAFFIGIVIVAGLFVLIGLGLFTANVLINVKVARDGGV